MIYWLAFLCLFWSKSAVSSDVGADFVYSPVHLENEELDVVKRQATQKSTQSSDDYTSVATKGGCKLYVNEIVFLRKEKTSESGRYETTEVNVTGDHLQSASEGTCDNSTMNGTIILRYTGKFVPKQGSKDLVLSFLEVGFHIAYSKPFGWWEVTNLVVEAAGTIIKDTGRFKYDFNRTVLRSVNMGASKKFSYACGQPPTLYYTNNTQTKDIPLIYGIRFRNLQIQPFSWVRHPGNFTDNVDDCVPFFSVGIWMFLVVASVLMLVVLLGVAMISNLKTMDRFDDPKGKPLVINAKE